VLDIVFKDAKRYFEGEKDVMKEYLNKTGKRILLERILEPYKDKLKKYKNKRLSIVSTSIYKGKKGERRIYRIDTYAPRNIPIMSSRDRKKLEKYKIIMEFYKDILKYEELNNVNA